MDDNQTDTTPEEGPRPVTYELRLKGGGITVEREIDEEAALQILATVMGGGEALTAARTTGKQSATTAARGPSRGRSLREYLDEVEPKRNVDKILAIASYLKVERDSETFDSNEVKKQFRSASEPVPGNYSRDFSWAVAAGWIAPAEDVPGDYYVTKKGDQAVAAKFSDEVKKATGVGKTARRRRPKKKADES
ncbi:MAG: hypothetical protein M3383_04310 [Actinomycetota bacterium]|nr:hypothetical protein [Actinomycetota bacterium]